MHARRKVLLIDDNDALRALLGQVLARDYDVVQLATAGTALDAIRSGGGATDLIITDLMMYDEVANGGLPPLASLAPGVPVIFISGYPSTHAVRRLGLDPAAVFLQKPFSLPRLLAEVEAIFAQQPASPDRG